MADYQVYQYTGENYGDQYSLKWTAAQVKKAKDYTELTTALTHNFFSKISVYDSNYARAFQFFYGGYHDPALGQGFRQIEVYGLPQVQIYQHPKPGDKVCLEIPNNRKEREYIYGSVTLMTTSTKMPWLLNGYDKFIRPDELFKFQEMKTCDVTEAIAFYQNLIFSYVLGLSPWGLEYADRHNNFTMSAILASKWPDEAIGNYGSDKAGIGALLKGMCEDLKKEIETEKNVRNVNVYPVHLWYPFKLSQQIFPDANKSKKYKKPTAKITPQQLKNLYKENHEIDPVLCAVAVARGLLHHVRMLTKELSFKNDSLYPGNLSKEDIKKYGTEEKGENAHMATPRIVDEQDLVIVMHPKMYSFLSDARFTSSYIKEGAYGTFVDELFKLNIITIDTIPYGGFKLTTKSRYLLKDLYRKVLSDSLNQKLVNVMSAHAGLVFGINKLAPCVYVKFTGLYVNPAVKDDMFETVDGVAFS